MSCRRIRGVIFYASEYTRTGNYFPGKSRGPKTNTFIGKPWSALAALIVTRWGAAVLRPYSNGLRYLGLRRFSRITVRLRRFTILILGGRILFVAA